MMKARIFLVEAIEVTLIVTEFFTQQIFVHEVLSYSKHLQWNPGSKLGTNLIRSVLI